MKKHTIDLFVEFINSLTELNVEVFLNMLKKYLQYICNRIFDELNKHHKNYFKLKY